LNWSQKIEKRNEKTTLALLLSKKTIQYSTMGAKQSRNVHLVQQDPELEKLVMDYLQKFDASRSSKGFMNRTRREVDVDSVQAMLKNKDAMDGIRKIFEEYEASRELTSSDMSVGSERSGRKFRPDSAFAA
jgi:hypothetical protein